MAKSNRVSKKVVALITPEEFSEAMSIYALNDAKQCKIMAKMDEEITKIREKYQDDLESCKAVEGTQLEVIETYCKEQKKVLFDKQRHIETAHGKVGFRMGTPKLKTLPKWTWDRVLERLEQIMPDYVRKKKEVNKEALLDNRNSENVAPFLSQVGVYVDQDETFYVELKKEEAA